MGFRRVCRCNVAALYFDFMKRQVVSATIKHPRSTTKPKISRVLLLCRANDDDTHDSPGELKWTSVRPFQLLYLPKADRNN